MLSQNELGICRCWFDLRPSRRELTQCRIMRCGYFGHFITFLDQWPDGQHAPLCISALHFIPTFTSGFQTEGQFHLAQCIDCLLGLIIRHRSHNRL